VGEEDDDEGEDEDVKISEEAEADGFRGECEDSILTSVLACEVKDDDDDGSADGTPRREDDDGEELKPVETAENKHSNNSMST
jgi:hypothetical protein